MRLNVKKVLIKISGEKLELKFIQFHFIMHINIVQSFYSNTIFIVLNNVWKSTQKLEL